MIDVNMQAVRDEILNIMHRNNIGEKRGTWMEDWHQKLHNNTTPDDVAICEAFIAFLKSNGDNGTYWGVLSDAGEEVILCDKFYGHMPACSLHEVSACHSLLYMSLSSMSSLSHLWSKEVLLPLVMQ